MTKPQINIPMDKLAELCKRWKIVELSLFGSVLRDDFGPDSDVDIMIEFDLDGTPSLFDLMTIGTEMSEIIGRPTDIITKAGIENSRNPFLKREILSSAEVFYAA